MQVQQGSSLATGRAGRLNSACNPLPRHLASASALCNRRHQQQPVTASPVSHRAQVRSAVLTRRQAHLTVLAMAAAASSEPSASAAGPHDLLIVGPGVLGSYLGKLWKEQYPDSRVVGLTNTSLSHNRLRTMGLDPVVKGARELGRFPYVAFSAPPSGSQDYIGEIRNSLQQHCDSSAASSSYVFTSSMGVCAAENGEEVTEDSCPLAPKGKAASTDKLLDAEQAVIQGGGNVMRLVGLYNAQRGAHTYFLKIKNVPRWGGYTVNLIHYEDAARITMSVLRGEGSGPFKGRTFIGCDGHPIKFKDMMDACNRSGVPSLQGQVRWTLPESQATKGKSVFNPATREALGGWTPKYESFESFMAQGAKDYYTTSGLF